MHEGRPSATAERVALRRAAHQLLDEPKVLDDPVAVRIADPGGVAQLRETGDESTVVGRYLRAFMVVRSRRAEDELARAVERGVRQYVVLGAGLDTFAYRNPYPPAALRVFEVDYPATQAWKRDRLRRAGIAIPPNLIYAPVDFETRALDDGLREAGFDENAPAFFSWLGVVPYLTPDAIWSTLRFVAARPAGSAVVFDYGLERGLRSPASQRVFDALAQRVAAAGEPWRTFFDPAVLARELRALGFIDLDDAGPEALNATYFSGRADGLRVGSTAHVMCARV